MREILFRGKSTKTNVWVFGSLVKDSTKEEVSIIDFADHNSDTYSWEHVVPESVGEFIGKQDMNGKNVFEGDVLENPNIENDSILGYASFSNGSFGVTSIHFGNFTALGDLLENEFESCQIIGNITDNPELL